MITLEPAIRQGRAICDWTLFPKDEYIVRVRALQQELTSMGVGAFVAFGHAADPAEMGYFSGFVPLGGWAAAVVHREGDPILITPHGLRELPLLQALTWVSDIRVVAGEGRDPASQIRDALCEKVSSQVAIGTSSAETALDARSYSLLLRALSGFEVRRADSGLVQMRRRKRPREQWHMARVAALVRGAVAAAAKAYSAGDSNRQASMAANAFARRNGAHDVRILATLDGARFSPLDVHASPARRQTLSLYCAVESLGYWCDALVTLPEKQTFRAERAVVAMVKAVRAQARVSEIARAALSEIPPDQHEVVLSFGLGGGLGLSPDEQPTITPESEERLQLGEILSLRTVLRENDALVCSSQTVIVGANEASPL